MKNRRISIAAAGWLALAFTSGTVAGGVLAGAVALAIAVLIVASVVIVVLGREYVRDSRSYQRTHALPRRPVDDRTPAIGDF